MLACPGGGILLPSTVIEQELRNGGHIELEANKWWAPSTQDIFGDDSLNGGPTAAPLHFYLPNGAVDPFGSKSWQHRDSFSLLTMPSVDAVGNTTTFGNNYTRLLPTCFTNANDNVAEFAANSFGRRVGLAAMGKRGQALGNSLDGFSANLTDDQVEYFLKNPSSAAADLLKNAGRRAIRCPGRSQKRTPACQAKLVRDTHYRDRKGDISTSITYLDGKR
ncbi:hypothetical protein J3459_006649 [Metarhizium acridum]|nr:hypothetical protein J3459_006649 [Metarhizium acridum]